MRKETDADEPNQKSEWVERKEIKNEKSIKLGNLIYMPQKEDDKLRKKDRFKK